MCPANTMKDTAGNFTGPDGSVCTRLDAVFFVCCTYLYVHMDLSMHTRRICIFLKIEKDLFLFVYLSRQGGRKNDETFTLLANTYI